ncbi:MAG: sugar phosphate nucleotidyltransferase [Thermodesulfovibrionales bacterium]|nr:sugar phosphate nucleotidyltransferase [Thermodesulfovibrionales bacterium]
MSKVFILAAGLGERLRPLTGHIPKPLLPVMGKPAIEHVMEKALRLSPDGVGINTSYKKETIEKWVRSSPYKEKITLFPEDPALGTGGALKNAEGFLAGGFFIVLNSDILTDIDLNSLLEFHMKSKNLATLAVHNHPEFANLLLDEKGSLEGISGRADAAGRACISAFTGIAAYSPEFLGLLPEGVSSVVDAWLKAVKLGFRVGTLDVSACLWQDIGTPASYARAVFQALRDEGETVYIHPGSKGCGYAVMDGYIVMEKDASIEKEASLRNCIILPGGRAEGGMRYENSIIGPDFRIGFKESVLPGFDEKTGGQLVGVGGSDWKYYRKKKQGKTVIAIDCFDCPNDDYTGKRHVAFTHFFLNHSIPVPSMEVHKYSLEFEDLGDTTLYSRLKCGRSAEEIESLYTKVLDALILIHSINAPAAPDFRVFDYDHFRWETGYFLEKYVNGIRGIKVEDPAALDEDFRLLALKADSYQKTIIHRDFQSQNIMIKDGEVRLIDYQGARLGPPAYDLASILWDSYYRLDDGLRGRLVEYYLSEMKTAIAGDIFMQSLKVCRLQRHMQALGAYGFLSREKGKRYFLKHVPEGLRLLKEDIAGLEGKYPALHGFVMKL